MRKTIFIAAALGALIPAAAASAQGVIVGTPSGTPRGTVVVGPEERGTTVILQRDMRPRFNEYVVQERVPSYTYDEDVVVGAELPSAGVTYYEVPSQYHVAPRYRYTVVNKRPVIVDPSTRRIVEVVE
jgi:hypothetical protein